MCVCLKADVWGRTSRIKGNRLPKIFRNPSENELNQRNTLSRKYTAQPKHYGYMNFLHLTSTRFPIWPLFPLMTSTEHPDLNWCTSRKKGLCPSTILLTAKPRWGSGPPPDSKAGDSLVEGPLGAPREGLGRRRGSVSTVR